ncbi:14407_t:CDS:1, partial [Funneliformis geosporum]
MLIKLETIFEQLLCFNQNNQSIEYLQIFDCNYCNIINTKIIKQIDIGFQYLYPKVVILEAEGNPNKNDKILATCNKYFENLNLNNNKLIEICYNEATFRC